MFLDETLSKKQTACFSNAKLFFARQNTEFKNNFYVTPTFEPFSRRFQKS